MRVLANDEFAFLNATFHPVELVLSCRNLVYGPETITETTLDFFVELIPYCEQLFQLPHLGPLRAPRSLCRRFHVPVHNAHIYLTLRHGSNKASSSLPFTGRAVFHIYISPASSLPQNSPRHQHSLLRTGIVQRTVRDNYRVC